MKRSGLAKELLEVREALNSAILQRDVLQTEKAEVAEALTKVSPASCTTQDLSTGHRLTPLGPLSEHVTESD